MLDDTVIAESHLNLGQSSKEELLAKLLDEYLSGLEQGTPIDLEKLIEANPELEHDIRTFAKSLDALHQATQSFRGEGSFSSNDQQTRTLGDFEIGPEIGRGGMGVVYQARQISLDRQVALKVLPFAAMWDEKQVVRFRNEAQAAAQLHHPNIVPVFAVGQERGVHFYAMQFVSGRSLGEVIRNLQNTDKDETTPEKADHRASVSTLVAATTEFSASAQGDHSQSKDNYYRTVARLGIQAAQAIHYAHECGVIHRDVKPSNLLLDSQGKLWITDFGLARVQNNSGVTMTGDVVGTLRYMSPEQAAGQQALVDQRTDVYALGATLYELLTLQAAFPEEDRRRVLLAIEQEEPTSMRSINPAIPADLETIVLQAMAKSRDSRYPTAQALAEDIDRFLQSKPTVARRPTLADRGVKWLKRHQLVATAAALSMLLVAILSTVGVILLARETAQKETALVAAEENLNRARLVVDRFGSRFSRELEQLPGSGPLREQLLLDTLAYYKEFIASSANDAQLKIELANTAFRAGTIAKRLGKSEEARQLFERALVVFNEADAAVDQTGEFLQQRATCYNELGLLEASQGNIQLASQDLLAAIGLQEKLAGDSASKTEVSRTLAEMLVNLGLLERRMGASAQAISTIQRSIQILETLVEESSPHQFRHRHDLAIALNNFSFVQQESDWLAARDSAQQAIEILSALDEEESKEISKNSDRQQTLQSDLALCLNNLGAIESHLGRHEQAGQLHKQAITLQEQLTRQHPAIVSHRSNLAVSWNNLGQALVQFRELEESNQAFEQAYDILQELVEDYPLEVAFRSSLAGILNNQAMSLEHVGNMESALKLYQSAIAHQKFAADQAPQMLSFRENLSKHYVNYGRALRKLDRPNEAAQVALQRRELWAGDGEQLYQVARELALAAGELDDQFEAASDRAQIAKDALSTLKQAISAQDRPLTRSIDAAEFKTVSDHPQFKILLTKSQ